MNHRLPTTNNDNNNTNTNTNTNTVNTTADVSIVHDDSSSHMSSNNNNEDGDNDDNNNNDTEDGCHICLQVCIDQITHLQHNNLNNNNTPNNGNIWGNHKLYCAVTCLSEEYTHQVSLLYTVYINIYIYIYI